MKTITICGKDCEIDCSAFTYIKYRQTFKTGLMEDIQKIQTFTILQSINKEKIESRNPNISNEELENKLGEAMIGTIDEFIEPITRITWILMYSADSSIMEYEKWLKTLVGFSINDKWIVEVAELAVNCFRGLETE